MNFLLYLAIVILIFSGGCLKHNDKKGTPTYDQKFVDIWISNTLTGSLSLFGINDTGNVVPKKKIIGDLTGLEGPAYLTIYDQKLYVPCYETDKIIIFNINDSGNIAPQEIIAGENTQLSHPTSIAIANNEIFVTNGFPAKILVYDLNSKGDISPKRVLDLNFSDGAFGLDIYENEIFVSVDDKVKVYNINDAGITLPKRTLNAIFPTDCKIVNGELFVTDYNKSARIAVFDIYANGNAIPKRVIQGSNTQLKFCFQTIIANEEIMIAMPNVLPGKYPYIIEKNIVNNGSSAEDVNKVVVFNKNDNGNIAPKRVIQGPSTKLEGWVGIAAVPLEENKNKEKSLNNLSLSSHIRGIEITWNDDDTSDIQGYYIWRTQNNNDYSNITPLLIPVNNDGQYSYLDQEATPNQTYSYKLECVNIKGQKHFLPPTSLDYK